MKPVGVSEIGRIVRQRRMGLGLSQDALAQKSGVTQTQISGIERGGTNVRVGTLMAVARTLGLEMMFVPRERLPAVQVVLNGETGDEPPLYALEDED